MSRLRFSLLFISIMFLCHTSVECVPFEEDVRITLEQKVAIDKFRARISSYVEEDWMLTDIYLAKWLRSTNFNLLRAEKKFIENIKWRKENKMAKIDQEDFSDIAKDYPYIREGFDKSGRPVMIAFTGDWDLRSAVVTGRIKRVLRYLHQGLEMLSRQIRVLQSEGKNVTQVSLIADLNQFSVVTHACVQCLAGITEFLSTYENHYIGMADRVLFINAPPSVQFVIELIRQNVSKETRDAIHVYGTNKEHWRKALLQIIEKKYLPVELGGTLERY